MTIIMTIQELLLALTIGFVLGVVAGGLISQVWQKEDKLSMREVEKGLGRGKGLRYKKVKLTDEDMEMKSNYGCPECPGYRWWADLVYPDLLNTKKQTNLM